MYVAYWDTGVEYVTPLSFSHPNYNFYQESGSECTWMVPGTYDENGDTLLEMVTFG